MAARSGKRTLEDQSCTESPVAATAVVLVTVPDTVTLPLGVAYVGLIDVIVTDSGWAGPACPGPVGRAGPALDAAAGATDRAATTTPAARATRACRADRRAVGWPSVPRPGRAGRRPPDVRHSRGMPKCYCGRAGAGAPEGMSPVPAAQPVSPRPPLPPTLDARARFPRPDPGTAPGGGGPAARNRSARGRPRAAVRPPGPRTRPGRRLRPGRLPRPRPR